MRLRLGIFSGAVPDWSVDRFAHAAAGAGFEAIEWELRLEGRHVALEDPHASARRCRAAAERAGLPVCGVSAGHGVSLLDDAHVAAVVGACHETGSALARVFAPPVSEDRPAADQLEEVAAALRRHADGFPDHGVTLAIELSEQTLVPSPELVRRVCGDADPRAVGAVYDAANMMVEGNVAPWFAVELMGPYLHHVHVKNEAWTRDGGRWAVTIVEPDEGLVDWPEVFRVLEAADYAGWVVIDHLSGPAGEERLAYERSKVQSLWQARSTNAG